MPKKNGKRQSLTGIIKKCGKHYVALCLELNVCSQGESIEEAKEMLEDACTEYLTFMKEQGLEQEIKPVPFKVLHEFLVEDVEMVRLAKGWGYAENYSVEVATRA